MRWNLENTSFLAFQRPQKGGPFGWRNSQPYIFSHHDGQYEWINNALDINDKYEDLRFFSKKSNGEKCWAKAPHSFYDEYRKMTMNEMTFYYNSNIDGQEKFYKATQVKNGIENLKKIHFYVPAADPTALYWHRYEIRNVSEIACVHKSDISTSGYPTDCDYVTYISGDNTGHWTMANFKIKRFNMELSYDGEYETFYTMMEILGQGLPSDSSITYGSQPNFSAFIEVSDIENVAHFEITFEEPAALNLYLTLFL